MSKFRYMAGLAAVALLPALVWAQPKAAGAAIAAKGGSQGAAACASCHGAQGEGNPSAGFPRLAGLPQAYIVSQLGHFADGSRQNAVMTPMAKQLTEAERTAVATYYAGLPGAPAVAAPATLKADDTGAWLAERGRWEQNLPACVQCHGPGGVGVGDAFPPLAGQGANYLSAQLKAFKAHTRPGGPDKLMATVASHLSDADIAAVSSHFAGAGQQSAAATTGKERQ